MNRTKKKEKENWIVLFTERNKKIPNQQKMENLA